MWKDITDNGIIAEVFKAILGKLASRREAGCLYDAKMPEVDELLCLFEMWQKISKIL